MKKTYMEIMEEMDRLEEVVISDELVDVLKDHFKEEIESDQKKKNENEQVAQGHLADSAKKNGDLENGQSDRV